MGPVARACLRLGGVAAASLLLALTVLVFLFDTPAVVRWFLASAALGGLSSAIAIVAWWLDA